MRPKRIYAVVWSWRKHKIVRTKKEGAEELKAWKMSYEAQGWKVRRSGPDAFIATHPETEKQKSIVFHEYDAETKERLYPEVKIRVKPEVPVVPKRHSHSKPAYA